MDLNIDEGKGALIIQGRCLFRGSVYLYKGASRKSSEELISYFYSAHLFSLSADKLSHVSADKLSRSHSKPENYNKTNKSIQ